MRIKLRHLKWFLFGKPDYPPRIMPQLKSPLVMSRSELIGFLFAVGGRADEIAQDFNITRERVKQILWKAYYQSYPKARRWSLPSYYWHYYYRFFTKDVDR
jgi:hypothetical protein